MPERKGKRKFFRELPALHMGPEGAAQPCRVSRAALKFLEKALVQRRIGSKLPRLFLLHWEAPRPGRGLDRRRPRPPASGLLREVHDSPREATPVGRTGGWSAAWDPGRGCVGLRLADSRKQKRRPARGGETVCVSGKSPLCWGSGTWVQMDR